MEKLRADMTDDEVHDLFIKEIKRHNVGEFTLIRRNGRTIICKANIEFRLPKQKTIK